MESPRKKLLIALSKGFRYKELFAKKISTFTAVLDLDSLVVDVMQDEYSIAEQYFAEKLVSMSTVKNFSRPAMNRSLQAYDYVIVFWDGDDLTNLVHAAKLLNIPLRLVPVQITKVRNKDNNDEYDVYIGRGTPWGNPFPIGKGGTGDDRAEVIKKYRQHFNENVLTDPKMVKAMLGLKGSRLGCHCSPLPCHGDIIAEFLNTYEVEISTDDNESQ